MAYSGEQPILQLLENHQVMPSFYLSHSNMELKWYSKTHFGLSWPVVVTVCDVPIIRKKTDGWQCAGNLFVICCSLGVWAGIGNRGCWETIKYFRKVICIYFWTGSTKWKNMCRSNYNIKGDQRACGWAKILPILLCTWNLLKYFHVEKMAYTVSRLTKFIQLQDITLVWIC